APVAERALERTSAVRLPNRPPGDLRMRRHQRDEDAFEKWRREGPQILDPRSSWHRHTLPSGVEEADAGHIAPVALRVPLDDLHERLLALAVADDVDEGSLAEERLRMVGYVRPAEHDQYVLVASAQFARDGAVAVGVPHVCAEADDVRAGERLGPAAHVRAIHHWQSEGVPLGTSG